MVRYIGIIDGTGDTWGVTLPDIDGCVGAGTTPEDAIESAIIALREVAAYRRQGGGKLPQPSTLTDILASGDYGNAPVTTLVPLLIDAGRTVRANLTFDAWLLDSIDAEAKIRGLTRSAFLASAAREKIEAGR